MGRQPKRYQTPSQPCVVMYSSTFFNVCTWIACHPSFILNFCRSRCWGREREVLVLITRGNTCFTSLRFLVMPFCCSFPVRNGFFCLGRISRSQCVCFRIWNTFDVTQRPLAKWIIDRREKCFPFETRSSVHQNFNQRRRKHESVLTFLSYLTRPLLTNTFNLSNAFKRFRDQPEEINKFRFWNERDLLCSHFTTDLFHDEYKKDMYYIYTCDAYCAWA